MSLDIKKFVDGLHKYIADELAPILVKLKALEARALEKGEKGERGERGERGEKGERGEVGEVGEKGERGEIGEKGDQGERGEKGDQGERGERGEVGEKGDQGERGERGEVGEKGERGEAGEKGEKGEKGERGEAGEKGERGEAGEKGEKGEAGEKGERGEDGASVTEDDVERAVEKRIAVYALELERRAADAIQKALDKIPTPKDGKDGADGLGFDDLSVVQLDEKRLKFSFVAGERKKEFVIQLPIIVDAGVYKSGSTYSKGDGVTYGGSFWIAQVEKPNQTPGKGAEWRLAVKRGKDAREVQS